METAAATVEWRGSVSLGRAGAQKAESKEVDEKKGHNHMLISAVNFSVRSQACAFRVQLHLGLNLDPPCN